jgi:hypothetical protein
MEAKNGAAIAIQFNHVHSAAERVMAEPTKSSPIFGIDPLIPPPFLAARALVVKKYEDRETGPASS